jgi:LysM repeat protein
MTGRSPARFLAPLALVAFVIALIVVVNSAQNDNGSATGTKSRSGDRPSSSSGRGGNKKQRKGPRRYTVKAGDTPSSIAEKTGVPLDQILRLNPNLDPQTLSPGQKIRLRQ